VVGPFAAFMRDEIEVTRSSLKLRFGLFDEAEVEPQEEKDEPRPARRRSQGRLSNYETRTKFSLRPA
jgi:hypothetical protein